MKGTKGKKRAKGMRSVPAAMTRQGGYRQPSVSMRGDVMVIKHREMFEVVNTTQSDVFWWTIQPGYEEMFPWLAAMADRFERYRFRSLKFEYIPRCPTSSSGTIAMCHDLDPNDPVPEVTSAGYRAMMSHEAAVSTAMWQSTALTVPGRHLATRGELFVRNSMETGTVEPRTSDFGVFFLYVQRDSGSGTLFGDLFVDYEIELKYPQLFSGPATTGYREGYAGTIDDTGACCVMTPVEDPAMPESEDHEGYCSRIQNPLCVEAVESPHPGFYDTGGRSMELPAGVRWVKDSAYGGLNQHVLRFDRPYSGCIDLQWKSAKPITTGFPASRVDSYCKGYTFTNDSATCYSAVNVVNSGVNETFVGPLSLFLKHEVVDVVQEGVHVFVKQLYAHFMGRLHIYVQAGARLLLETTGLKQQGLLTEAALLTAGALSLWFRTHPPAVVARATRAYRRLELLERPQVKMLPPPTDASGDAGQLQALQRLLAAAKKGAATTPTG